ncbi:MAG: type II toxin-antitoxin system RelE/ParE family toxin [Betaproteobacteria bacterium]|nr:MAG: type II toxin-antitoxin system RelE/ParE family toxin [Betaproteobacteria bacterium]
MRVLKLKAFARWARKEGLADASLRVAVLEMRRGLVDADLGGGLLKKRVARPGGGKRGGYRTIVAADLRERWVFLYGFAKSERDDLDDDEVRELKRLAKSYLPLREEVLERLIDAGALIEVKNGEPQAS